MTGGGDRQVREGSASRRAAPARKRRLALFLAQVVAAGILAEVMAGLTGPSADSTRCSPRRRGASLAGRQGSPITVINDAEAKPVKEVRGGIFGHDLADGHERYFGISA